MARILFVESDDSLAARAVHFFRGDGHLAESAPDFERASTAVADSVFDVIIADIAMPDASIQELLSLTARMNGSALLIVTCDAEGAAEAVRAVQEGVFDFIQKPYRIAELYVKVEKALEVKRLQQEALNLRGERKLIYRTGDFIGASPRIREVLDLVQKIAKSDSSVIITGETGTGKELIAGAIHYNSHRAKGAFVRVNCAALPEELLENELFGHERGAYTGADRLRIGRFEQADGGSIFLDEIGDMSLVTQAKILRVIQEREFERLGANRTIRVDVRIIAATNRDLGEEIRDGSFRADLYYRLNVITITVPPLRERREDISPLALFFLRKHAREMGKALRRIDDSAMRLLERYDWPGNIRELENTIERAVILAEADELSLGDLGFRLDERKQSKAAGEAGVVQLPPEGVSLQVVEKELIVKALERSGWVQKDAARLLGLTARALNYRVEKHGITHPGWKRNR